MPTLPIGVSAGQAICSCLSQRHLLKSCKMLSGVAFHAVSGRWSLQAITVARPVLKAASLLAGIADVDTREITRRLRDTGALNGIITTDMATPVEELVEKTKSWSILGKVLPTHLPTCSIRLWAHISLEHSLSSPSTCMPSIFQLASAYRWPVDGISLVGITSLPDNTEPCRCGHLSNETVQLRHVRGAAGPHQRGHMQRALRVEGHHRARVGV